MAVTEVSSDDAPDDYVNFDVTTDALASLELVVAALVGLRSTDFWWKWVIVGAHMGASTSMVGYLTGTAGVGALDDRSTKALLDWYDSPKPRSGMPDDRLADFPVLVERMSKGERGANLGTLAIDVSASVEKLIKLNWVRARFNHFRDAGWSIEKAYIVPLVQNALALIRDIEDDGWAFRHGEEADRQRLRVLLDDAMRQLEDLETRSAGPVI